MPNSRFPLIEAGHPVQEFYVDGVCRIDDVGSLVHIWYFQYARDPHVNDGAIYRIPVLKHIRSRDTLQANAGVVKRWIDEGRVPDLIAPAALQRKIGLM